MKTAIQYVNYLRVSKDSVEKNDMVEYLIETYKPHTLLVSAGHIEGTRVMFILFADRSVVVLSESNHEPEAYDLDDFEDLNTLGILINEANIEKEGCFA